MDDNDKKTISEKVDEIIQWLDKNQTADKEEIDHKYKDLESVCMPIITKLYQSQGGNPMNQNNGPTVEEVD